MNYIKNTIVKREKLLTEYYQKFRNRIPVRYGLISEWQHNRIFHTNIQTCKKEFSDHTFLINKTLY